MQCSSLPSTATWQSKTLADICFYGTDKIASSQVANDAYYSTENMLPDRGGAVPSPGVPAGVKVTRCSKGDVLVSNIRPYFKKIVFCRKDAACSSNVLCFRAKESVSPRFLYYLLASDNFFNYVMSGAKGTKMPCGDKKHILSYNVKIPPLNIQKKIENILSFIDDKIDVNIKINENLQQQSQALFKSWFVDFEPWGGAMPEDWRIGTLSELVDICYGKDHKTLQNGKYPAYGSGGVMRFVEKYIYEKESVLIPRKGTLNNVIYVNKPFWTIDTMFFTKMKKENIAKYVYFFISSINLSSMNTGSAVPSMTTRELNSINIPIPSTQILSNFEKHVSRMYEIKEKNNTESQILSQLRDTLLPKLLSGELDVSNMDL